MANNQLLIATNNPHKVQEIQAILGDLPIKLLSAADLGLNLSVVEDGSTYFENALKKARAFFEATGLPTLADDSGLEVALLDSLPGIHSHRFAPMENATDRDRRHYLLQQLANFPQPWLAEFHCEIVFITPDELIHNSHGICSGKIVVEERGENGFGYDPIFCISEKAELTMAQLPDTEKNLISHRANALVAIKPVLLRFFSRQP